MARGPQRLGNPNPTRIFRYQPATGPPPAGTVYNDTLTEAGAASDALTITATFPNALAEVGASSDALTSTAVFPNAVAESVAAADSLASTGSFAGAVAEAGGAVDTLDTTATFPNALGESGAASDTISGGLFTSDAITEVGSAADALSAVQAFASTLAEALAAADDLAALGVWPNDLAEAGAAVDLVDAPLPATYDEALTEAAFALDSYDAGPLPAGTLPPPDQLFGNVIFLNTLGRKVAVYDERLTETARAGDEVGSFAGWLEALGEPLNAVDALGARAEMRATLGEGLVPGVELRGAAAIRLALSESATAWDGLESGGYFNPADEMLALTLLLGDDLLEKRGIAPIDRDREKVANARDAVRRVVGEFFAHLSLHLATKARGLWKAEEDDPVVATAEAADYEALGKAVAPHLREVAKDAAALGLEQVTTATHTSLTQANERAVAWAEDRAGALVTQVSETTQDGVRALVARALDEGWSNDELAQELLDSGVFAASRAEAIARTEVAMADTQGVLIGWKESGVVSGKEWKTGGGPCDLCDELDGEAVGLDDDFPDGDPPLHPNCRCTVLPVLADEE